MIDPTQKICKNCVGFVQSGYPVQTNSTTKLVYCRRAFVKHTEGEGSVVQVVFQTRQSYTCDHWYQASGTTGYPYLEFDTKDKPLGVSDETFVRRIMNPHSTAKRN
jgi:hypothetical protein